MRRSINYFDLSVLITISLVLASIFYLDVKGVSYYTINDLLAILVWLFCLEKTFWNVSFGQYLLLGLLILSLANVITYEYTIDNTTYSSRSSMNLGALSFNPFAFVLLIFYTLINKGNLKVLINKLIYGSEEEKKEKVTKMTNFYYDKFVSLEPDELNKVFKDFKDYPEEAQIALKKINGERETSIIK
jgi:hypothetical protein